MPSWVMLLPLTLRKQRPIAPSQVTSLLPIESTCNEGSGLFHLLASRVAWMMETEHRPPDGGKERARMRREDGSE